MGRSSAPAPPPPLPPPPAPPDEDLRALLQPPAAPGPERYLRLSTREYRARDRAVAYDELADEMARVELEEGTVRVERVEAMLRERLRRRGFRVEEEA